MSRVTKCYMLLIGAIGIGIGLYSFWRLFFSHAPLWSAAKLPTFCVLLLLSWICYCLPLYVRDDCTVDLSFISTLASILTLGPEFAVIISMISYPLSVSTTFDGKERIHIFNTAPIKTLFNMGNCNIALMIGGVVYYMLGGTPGNITLPGVLPPAFFYIVLSIAANVVVILLYYLSSQETDLRTMVAPMFLGLLPSIALSSPIGYFLAMLLVMHNGAWLALLFMLPLLLARYSFKLYLDGQRQQYSIIRAFAAALDAKDTYTARPWKTLSVNHYIVNHRILPVHAAHGPDHPVYADVPQGQAGNRNFVKCLQENPVIASVGNDVFNGYIVEYRQVTAISPIFIKHGAVDRRPVDMVHHTVRQYDILHPASTAGIGL